MALCDEWAAILIVFCCCLPLIAICTNCRLKHYKIREKSDFDLHLDEGMELVSNAGHLHDDVFLLIRPEFISFFLSYLNLVTPVRFN